MLPSQCDVVIVGGGVAGASAAYHLHAAGAKNIVVIECGSVGNGSYSAVSCPSYAQSDIEPDKGSSYAHGNRSGTAVLPKTSTIKMMVRLYACSSKEFIHHHGVEGAKRYLNSTTLGK